MLIPFNSSDELKPQFKTEIAGLIKSAFKEKFSPVFSRLKEEEWIPMLEELLSFERGLYYKDDEEILGVAILLTAGGQYMNIPPQIGRKIGWVRSHILKYLFENKIEDPEILHLEMLAVSPNARGKGIGTKLLNSLPAIAREEGRHKLTLEVVDTNPRALKLYESMGYSCKKTKRTGFLTAMAGFKAYSLMEKLVEDSPQSS
jgi:ribosomal protein S18 acetylase RimI-like enzyme